ncbi:hypothetical protein ACFQI7_21700 [Paenibacillus allorhizosphaerae]|uniref:WD40 repeat domain-containing protein n=1 Tax=Paenibacillus allorhizosphaerae TaxID=2849866 RepID=A0ABM8VN45_9BACL|nr:hypothetical protein [Paenibacillus allorhizosphaerae]CAG7650892.1 hypothetical protein PAECIP111802_04832 [Paenibacillus allorhizosphaerae]
MIRNISVYLWYLFGFSLSLLLFLGLYLISGSSTTTGSAMRPENAADMVTILTGAQSYHVIDAFKVENATAPVYEFPALAASKSKITKGTLFTLKDKAHVVEQYGVPDHNKIVYFVMRTEEQDGGVWNQTDAVTIDPKMQTMQSDPIGYSYGSSPEEVAQVTKLLGFVNNDEFLYITLKNEGSERVLRVNRFSVAKRTVTPVLDLYRFKDGDGALSSITIAESAVSPDGRRLLVKDSRKGIVSYDMNTGAAKVIAPPAELGVRDKLFVSREAGVALYEAGLFRNDVRWIDLNSSEAKLPFASETGLLEAGMDASRKLLYYNFTYDREVRNFSLNDKKAMLYSYGVQMTDLKGVPIQRFSLPKESQERLEYGGCYSEDKKIVLLHRFTVETNSKGMPYKKTTGWLTGDLATGTMTVLQKIDVPDSWERKDMLFGSVFTDVNNDTAAEQVFVNTLERTYYTSRWRTKEAVLLPEEDAIMFADETSKRIFVSSFTRPDLIVAVNNYKKYNWDNRDFVWLSGHWLSRYHTQPEGDKIYFFQIPTETS